MIPGVPSAMLRNATLFAAFGSMYFSVISMSDAEHRRQFFAPVIEKVERTLEVRAVYLDVRARACLARRRAELTAVLAAELRRAVVADPVTHAGHVVRAWSSSSRASWSRICFWNWIGLIAVTAWKLR